MSRLFVTLAVLVIVHNEMTFGHFHHPGFGPDFKHGPGHHHHFGHGPGHHHGPGHPPGFHHGPGHPPGFHPGPGHLPGSYPGPGHNPDFHNGPGHPPGFHPGPGHLPGTYPGPGHNPDFHHGSKNVPGQQEPGANEIRKKYAEILGILHNSCQNNSIVPKIIYSTTSYVIIYNLPDTKDLKATVTIQNQILATQVTGTGAFKGFSDVRVLPDILKVSEAKWVFQGSDLKILIPYKTPLGTMFTAECTPGNESIIQVTNPSLPTIYPRMSGDD